MSSFVPRIRTLVESDEWQASLDKALICTPQQWDDAFRAAGWNIATKPYVNTTPFLTDRDRILTLNFPGIARLSIYFQIDETDDVCTLQWVESYGGQRVLVRVG